MASSKSQLARWNRVLCASGRTPFRRSLSPAGREATPRVQDTHFADGGFLLSDSAVQLRVAAARGAFTISAIAGGCRGPLRSIPFACRSMERVDIAWERVPDPVFTDPAFRGTANWRLKHPGRRCRHHSSGGGPEPCCSGISSVRRPLSARNSGRAWPYAHFPPPTTGNGAPGGSR